MKYQCLDCGHKANKLSQGRCPACQSTMVKTLRKESQGNTLAIKKEPSYFRICMMMVLWGVLLYKGYTYLMV